MGLAPELDNFYVACGFTAGIAASGGAGLALANTILHGDAGMDLWPFDVRRFGAVHAQGRYLEERAIEAYGAYYKIHWPARNRMRHAGCGSRRCMTRCATMVLCSVPNSAGSGRTGSAVDDGTSIELGSFEDKPNWFDAVGEEVRAIRERAALIDQTSFSKFEISGDGALGSAAGASPPTTFRVRPARPSTPSSATRRAASRPT